MSRAPSFQFYPGDWLRNANLRRCTIAERGVWIEIMCLMHDSETYGVLHWPVNEIADALRVPKALVKALVTKGVMKGVESGKCQPYSYAPRTGHTVGPSVVLVPAQAGPIWYSPRMVRDHHIRLCRANGKNPDGTPKATFGDTNG